MCDLTEQQIDMLETTIDNFIDERRMFTGYDVTRVTREREEVQMRHRDVAADIHELDLLTDAVEYGDYKKHSITSPEGGSVILYYPEGGDPNEYELGSNVNLGNKNQPFEVNSPVPPVVSPLPPVTSPLPKPDDYVKQIIDGNVGEARKILQCVPALVNRRVDRKECATYARPSKLSANAQTCEGRSKCDGFGRTYSEKRGGSGNLIAHPKYLGLACSKIVAELDNDRGESIDGPYPLARHIQDSHKGRRRLRAGDVRGGAQLGDRLGEQREVLDAFDAQLAGGLGDREQFRAGEG